MTYAYSEASERQADEWDAEWRFIRALEARSMSTWTDEELARYSQLTGQDESK